jgi:magnesium-transporting ATPase (P-type)
MNHGRAGAAADARRADASAARPEAGPTPWHARALEDILAHWAVDKTGLSEQEATARLAQYGPNALPESAPPSALARFFRQLHNFLIYVLLSATAIMLVLGHWLDAGVILAVVLVNASIGFVQEGRAQQALRAIRAMMAPKASVLREARRSTVDATVIVPGDLLLLEAGDRVAADVRLLEARNLHLDESVLTGESVPVQKNNERAGADAPLAERHCMAWSGTLVTAGSGVGIVVATGIASELGRISALLGRVEQIETPLIRRMDAFARQLTFVIGAAASALLAFAVLGRGHPPAEAFIAVVAIAIAAIPEGLPAVLTITLAIGVQRMAGRHAIIRRLPAVETLGSVSTVCSDKTGTLTRNEMTVTHVVLADRTIDVGGVGYAPKGGFSIDDREIEPAGEIVLEQVARAALLCNDAALGQTGEHWTVDGDPMGGALLSFALKTGLDPARTRKALPRIDEIPFDAVHRYMATLHRDHSGHVVAYVKGAPERILEMCHCQRVSTATGIREVAIDKVRWRAAVERSAGTGRRVLALASRPFPSDKSRLAFGDVDQGLTLEGLVGLIDPPRPEAIEAVAECRRAGIAVRMITGDHAATAKAIAAELGIADADRVLTGADLDELDDRALQEAIRTTGVFARTDPEHKLRLVEAMQAEGAIIAMTGDGVNDAPALKRADVGVAMGRGGTEAAKEAADMVLADDNFASLVAAVREGRTVYDNLMKVIGFILPINGGESIVIATAILLGLTLPITPLQILWVNMVSSVALALTLAFEPTEPDVMRRPPRSPDEPPLTGFLLWRIVLVSLAFAAGAFGVFTWATWMGHDVELARTLVVNAIVVMEIFYLFAVRYLKGPSLTWQGVLGTPAVLAGVALVVALQLTFTYAPFMQVLFQARPVGFLEGAVVIGCGVALLLVLEIEKQVRRTFPGW